MANISDIPLDLLEPIMRVAFKNWLRDLPLDDSGKRSLAKAYRDALNQEWKEQDFIDAGLSSGKEPV